MLVVEIGGTAGLWLRAGQTGTVVGLDWPAALALVPPHIDRERIIPLLRAWEGGLIAGSSKSAKAAAELDTIRRESQTR